MILLLSPVHSVKEVLPQLPFEAFASSNTIGKINRSLYPHWKPVQPLFLTPKNQQSVTRELKLTLGRKKKKKT